MKEFSERHLTTGYILALGLIALLTIASHLTLNRVLATHEGSAAIVNLSGRQRMLSQRIASLAAQVRFGTPGARADMMQAVDAFAAAHRRLLAETTAKGGGRNAKAFRDIYFGGADPLDGEVTDYLALARRIAAEPADSPALDRELSALFTEARAPLLNRLDQVVRMHQQDSEAQLSRLQWLQLLTMIVVLLALAVEALLIFRPMVRRIARYTREMHFLASTDGLTGLLNRRAFLERGEIEVLRARRSGLPPAVLMVDADHFRALNANFGHAGGDVALRALGKVMRSSVRPGDLLGRVGGEEFAILLPLTSRAGAASLAERLRAAVAELELDHGGRKMSLTISIGVAGDLPTELPVLLREADAALYQAKTAGRNRVCFTP